jgi:hypothetical protein
VLRRGVTALGDEHVGGQRTGRLDVRARRVEMGVVRDDLARATDGREEDLLRCPALVDRDDVPEREQLANRIGEDAIRR